MASPITVRDRDYGTEIGIEILRDSAFPSRLPASVRFLGARPVKGLFNMVDYRSEAIPALDALYSWRPSVDQLRKLDPIEEPSEVSAPRKGQGRQMDSLKRDLVEEWAMGRCRETYESEGFTLDDTSSTQPFDYIARKQNSLRRIEAKGTTSGLGKVVITAGELAAVRSDNVPTDLFVVYDIRLVEFAPAEFRAEGGQIYQERNWTPATVD